MKKDQVAKNAFAMPLYRPSYPRGPYRFNNCEFSIVTYETDRDVLKEVVPEPRICELVEYTYKDLVISGLILPYGRVVHDYLG